MFLQAVWRGLRSLSQYLGACYDEGVQCRAQCRVPGLPSPSPRGLRDQMLSACAPPQPWWPCWRALRPFVPTDQSRSSGWAGSLPQTSCLSSASLRRKFLCSAILACLNQCCGQTGCGLCDSHEARSRGWFLFSVVLRGNTHHCHHRYHQAQGTSGPWRRAPGLMGGLNSAGSLTPP